MFPADTACAISSPVKLLLSITLIYFVLPSRCARNFRHRGAMMQMTMDLFREEFCACGLALRRKPELRLASKKGVPPPLLCAAEEAVGVALSHFPKPAVVRTFGARRRLYTEKKEKGPLLSQCSSCKVFVLTNLASAIFFFTYFLGYIAGSWLPCIVRNVSRRTCVMIVLLFFFRRVNTTVSRSFAFVSRAFQRSAFQAYHHSPVDRTCKFSNVFFFS